MTHHGSPCWYELSTRKPEEAGKFYGGLLGWTLAKAPMEGFDYYLASAGEAMVAGMMAPPDSAMPTYWMIYFAVDDTDGAVRAMSGDGAMVIVPPTDIPGTGRFAILTDPQGAAFGLLQPLPMENGGAGGAFDQKKTGHGNWHELMTSDPAAALAFYGKHLGWTPSTAIPMGEMGTYQLFAWQGADIGGMMGLPAPGMPPAWLPYFGAEGIDAAVAKASATGGTICNGPMEVPGGAWIIQATDPEGTMFALVGPK